LGISNAAGSGYWVGEGLPKPLTNFNFDKTTMPPLKCANIVVLTEDLLRRESYSAETLVRDEMVNALVQLIDSAFIDPTNAGTATVKPASLPMAQRMAEQAALVMPTTFVRTSVLS
jgi:HK97 family phage major capsid protein